MENLISVPIWAGEALIRAKFFLEVPDLFDVRHYRSWNPMKYDKKPNFVLNFVLQMFCFVLVFCV